MSDMIVVNNPYHTQAISRLVGVPYNPRSISLSRMKDDVLLGGVVFYDFTGESMCVHIGAWEPHWLNRDMLFCMFDYPLNQMRAKRVFAKVPEDNTHSLSFCANVGFRRVARIEGVYENDTACIVLRIDRADCERFLKIKPRHTFVPRRMVH
jgi:RimJ/RimL family protein N-acetyltransferase